MNSDVVQSVANPDTASALEQFLGRDVDLLVNPTVVLVLSNIIALLARDTLFLLHFVASGTTVEVHLERGVVTIKNPSERLGSVNHLPDVGAGK